jgi:hypothetical protein
VTWLLRKKAPGFSPKDEPSHCHHWKHKSVPWTSEKKNHGPGAMSDLVISTMVKHRMILRILR